MMLGGPPPILVGDSGCRSPTLLAWGLPLAVVGVFDGVGWLCSACVCSVWRARSYVLVCAVLFVVSPVVPPAFVFASVLVLLQHERSRVHALVLRIVVPVAMVCVGCTLLCTGVGAVSGLCVLGVRAGVCVCVWLCVVCFGVWRDVWVQVCGLWALPNLFWSELSADMVRDDKSSKIWLCTCVACGSVGSGRSGF